MVCLPQAKIYCENIFKPLVFGNAMTNNWKQVNMEIGQLWVFKGAFLASLTSWLWTAIFPSSKIKYTPESCLLFCTLAGLRAVQDNMSTMLQWDDTAYSSEVHWDQTQNSLCLSQGWPAPADLEHCTPKQLFFFFLIFTTYTRSCLPYGHKLLDIWEERAQGGEVRDVEWLGVLLHGSLITIGKEQRS